MKFKIPENFNDLSLRDIFQQLKVPKKDLHHLNMSKDITINDKPARLMDKVHTGDDVFVPTIDEKVIMFQVIVMHKLNTKVMIWQS